MSTKHFFPDSVNDIVIRALRGLIATNPTLGLLEPVKVVYNTLHTPSKVALISGGGGGHEPAWTGFVGNGALAAAVSGDVFASPSAKQVLAAIDAVPSDVGTILLITNYTGDNLHFGLAREKAIAKGARNVEILRAMDDVAIGRKGSELVGRRGLAGNILGLKILGGAAESGKDFEYCMSLGRAVNDQVVTVGASLDHCHVPGRKHHEQVEDDTCVLGMGIHNEPGLRKISPAPSAEDLIKEMLLYLLDSNDPDRAFVKFDKQDDVALLVNNFGGTSNLELLALANEAVQQLKSTWSIVPSRVYSGSFETSLNGPGFSLSLLNISNTASQHGVPSAEVLKFLDLPTDALAWQTAKWSAAKEGKTADVSLDTKVKIPEEKDVKLDPKLLDKMVRQACERAIASEPDLTKWDMQMGDGDCGEAVKAVSIAIKQSLDAGLGSSGSLHELLSGLTACVDDMGGSLGAILGIFLAALHGAILAHSSQPPKELYALACSHALQRLQGYTSARKNDHTVMDALIPFCEALDESKDLRKAVEAAKKGAEATRSMKPRFGRATYVGEKGMKEAPPDPGAWAFSEMVKGLQEGLEA